MPPSSRQILRRRLTGLAVLVAVAVFAIRAGAGSDSPERLRVQLAGRTLATVPSGSPAAELPEEFTVTRERARITFAIDGAATQQRMRSAAGVHSSVTAAARPVSASVQAPAVAQALPNNCETAALQVLLTTLGVDAPQLELQAEVQRDGPLDPIGSAPAQVWGDPELGYVGRADGTGPAGGFGVYQRPIASLAQSRGVILDDLTGGSTEQIVTRVLGGRAVMVWVGLDDGPYGEWSSPAGEPVRVNFNEHTVVLTGVREDGRLDVVNVLEGTREVWSLAFFEERFDRLGRRALAAPV